MKVTEHSCEAAASSHARALGKGISCAVRRKGNEASMLVVIACCSYIFCCVLRARIIVDCEQLQCKEIVYCREHETGYISRVRAISQAFGIHFCIPWS